MSLAETPVETAYDWSNENVENDQDNSTATFEDLKARIIYQHKTYLEREKEGKLTSFWIRYERQHGEEINLLRKRLENEASF